jgi:hypothetical protein
MCDKCEGFGTIIEVEDLHDWLDWEKGYEWVSGDYRQVFEIFCDCPAGDREREANKARQAAQRQGVLSFPF